MGCDSGKPIMSGRAARTQPGGCQSFTLRFKPVVPESVLRADNSIS